MKNYLYFISVFAGLATGQALAETSGIENWGAATNYLQMSISLKGGERQIKTNQAIVLSIQLRNLSTNETFHFYQYGEVERSQALSFCVIPPSGKTINPKTPWSSRGQGSFVDVGPGEVKGIEFNLSKICKFDELGTYKIVGGCFLGYWLDREGKISKNVRVNSNPLNVSIVSSE